MPNLPRVAALRLVAASLAAAAPPAALGADVDTDQLTVTATVLSGCALTGGSIAFGQYVSGQATDLDAVGQINYTNCNGTLRFELDGGGNGDGSSRQMSLGQSRLRYQLYRNSPRSQVFGAGVDAQGIQTIGTQTGKVDVFGRIFGGQLAEPGSYTDTVNITLTF